MSQEYVKISQLDSTSSFGTEDHFVLVQNAETLKISAIDLVSSLTTLTNLATRSFVTAIVDSAPETLDTLNELAAALNDDANFASTITNSIASKLDTSSFGLKFWEELAQVNTYHITEGSNLYWTQERFDTAFASKNTYHLEEGSNLYFTEQRVLDVVTPLIPNSIFDLGVPDVGTPENIPGYLYYNGNSLSWQPVSVYSLPTASTSELGGVKVDGNTIVIDSYGTITAVGGGVMSPDPVFDSVTTTQLNVQNVEFTGTGAVTISSGNDLNLLAAGNVSINGETLSNVAFSGAYADLTGKPTLFGGSYNDLTNKPNIVEKTTGSWTLAAGANTVSLTVPGPGAYSIWVNGNIPNGIVTYTATVVVTNNNVPVVGSSYGWYYADGNALVLTAIPTHIVGTANNISTYTVATTTANVFTFGITNNSGSNQIVNWGYTKL